MEINNGKLEDDYFGMNSMEQMSKIFSRSCQNKNSVKGDIITYIKLFQQTMLMEMVDTPDVIKQNNLSSHSLVPFKRRSMKSASNIFGVSKRSMIQEIRK